MRLNLTLSILVALSLTACDGMEDLFTERSWADEPESELTVVGNALGNADCVDCDEQDGVGGLCVGLRGNGARIFSHFGSLARIHEHYGLIQGVAGGSSAGISAFLLESLYANPAVFQCGDAPCTEEESALRISFLLKSLEMAPEVVGKTRAGLAVNHLAESLGVALGDGLGAFILSGNVFKAVGAITQLFWSKNFKAMLDGTFLHVILNSPNKMFHIKDFAATAQGFGKFEVEGQSILVRPGLVRFESVAEKVGRLGSFYAMYGPSDVGRWHMVLDDCAPESQGLLWTELSERMTSGGRSCGQTLRAMLEWYMDELEENPSTYENRIDDRVGAYLPSLVSTSVVTGWTAIELEWAQKKYREAESYEMFPIYSDVRFGYWGDEQDLERIATNPMGYTDEKTARFMALGPASYRTALSYSPAEPGLATVTKIDEDNYSAGGWPDHAPTTALKNMGCEQVILVTRRGSEAGFRIKLSEVLGMTEADREALYEIGSEDSAIAKSLAEADGVWCTDFDSYGPNRSVEILADGYNAPMETHGDALLKVANPYANTDEELGLPSCTPGVPAPAETP